jgi:hypothetical protein
VNIASAFPRVFASHLSIEMTYITKYEWKQRPRTYMSPIKAPDVVSGDAAKHPPRNRNIRIEAVFGARAQPTWKS